MGKLKQGAVAVPGSLVPNREMARVRRASARKWNRGPSLGMEMGLLEGWSAVQRAYPVAAGLAWKMEDQLEP